MEENGQDALKHRDRDIYLQKIAPAAAGQGDLTQPFLLHRWLKVRQQQEADQTDGSVLPGRVWNELYRISCLLILLLGLTSGSGLAFSFLGYSGTEPVNVSMYLAIFVGVQILLIALLGAASLYRLLWRLDLRSSVLYSLLSGLMVRGMLRLNGYIGKKADRPATSADICSPRTRTEKVTDPWFMFSLADIYLAPSAGHRF